VVKRESASWCSVSQFLWDGGLEMAAARSPCQVSKIKVIGSNRKNLELQTW